MNKCTVELFLIVLYNIRRPINILMNTTLNEKLIAYFALVSGLIISTVAIFYSVSGLISIYPMAVIPIAIMGIAIEVGKLSMTLWLKQNWNSPWIYKVTMIPAVIILMIITSGGVFGFLSKAHSDQKLISGDAQARVQLIDDRIQTIQENISFEKDNIESSRLALAQLDNQVNSRLGMGFDDGTAAERSVQIRRSQRNERTELANNIQESQNEIDVLTRQISELKLEKSPLETELRKIEAEVGPVKYIAALIYGDNPDSNLLERAVRWVTLMIVIVMDPVAIILLLASQYSFQQIREKKFKESISSINSLDDNLIEEKNIEKEESPDVHDTSPTTEENELKQTNEDLISQETTVIEEQSSYVQNEEQKDSNLWSTTTSLNSITEVEYLDKVKKLIGK